MYSTDSISKVGTIPKDGELTSYTLGSGDGGSITNVTDPKLKTSMALSYT